LATLLGAVYHHCIRWELQRATLHPVRAEKSNYACSGASDHRANRHSFLLCIANLRNQRKPRRIFDMNIPMTRRFD
jgi:hypothetical protein